MMAPHGTPSYLLLFSAVLLSVLCTQVATTSQRCPYPAVKLLARQCQPTPDWCQRLRGHGKQNWRRCRPKCSGKRLQFGAHAYPVAWSRTAGKKRHPPGVPVLGLALTGWRRRSLAIWRGRVFARVPGVQGWRIVYQQANGQLVAAALESKPPRGCAKKEAGKRPQRQREGGQDRNARRGKHFSKQLRGLTVSCHGNACTLRLSLGRLLRQAKRLSGRRGRANSVDIRFRLSRGGRRKSGLRFVSARLALAGRTGRGRGKADEDDKDPAAAYRHYLTERRERYWRRKAAEHRKKSASPRKNARNSHSARPRSGSDRRGGHDEPGRASRKNSHGGQRHERSHGSHSGRSRPAHGGAERMEKPDWKLFSFLREED